jgi:zinc transporter
MRQDDMLKAGVEAGLRFASVLDGRGGCIELDWRGVAAWVPEQGFLWIHLERDNPTAMEWVRMASGVQPLVADALLDDESRPTVEAFDEALLLVLRGVNIAESGESDAMELVPMHLWIDPHRVITLRDSTHALSALRDIRLALKAGRGPRRPGGLLAQICEKIVRDVGPSVEEMDEEVETLEDTLIEAAPKELRRTLADLRRRAVHLRRYLGPQREALIRLQTDDTRLLDKPDRMRLRCVIDSV